MNFRKGHQHPWFTEGGTSYLEALLLLRCGAIDGEFFLQSLVDRWFRAKAGRPARFSLEEASSLFTRDLGATSAVYERGALNAFALDLDLRAAGSSVEALVRRLVVRGALSGDRGQSSREILSSVRALAGVEGEAALLERTATKAAIDLNALLQRVGYELWMRDAPLLGVRLQPRARPVVEAVQPGSPAEGLLRGGDVLCAIGEQAFDDPGSFERVLRAQAPGQVVRFLVQRQGQAVEVEIELGRRAEPRIRPQLDANRAAQKLRAALFEDS